MSNVSYDSSLASNIQLGGGGVITQFNHPMSNKGGVVTQFRGSEKHPGIGHLYNPNAPVTAEQLVGLPAANPKPKLGGEGYRQFGYSYADTSYEDLQRKADENMFK